MFYFSKTYLLFEHIIIFLLRGSKNLNKNQKLLLYNCFRATVEHLLYLFVIVEPAE